MSSLLTLQTKDTIIFASDTALSANIKGENYRVDNNESKIFEYDEFIMFASGKKYLRDLFINLLSGKPSLQEIQCILDRYILKYSEEFSLEIVIAMKDLSKLIFLSSSDEFKYKESLPAEYINLYTAGYLNSEIANEFEDNYNKYPLLQSLKNTYKKKSCSEIGGNLDIFILEKNNIKKIKYQIDDMKTHSDEELLYKLNLVHAERLVGRIILSNKLVIEDDVGVITIQSGLMTVYDQSDSPRVYLGRYPKFNNPNQFDYGLRVINGAFDIRTSNDTDKGIVINGDSISAYNNNGVRTFNVDAVTGLVSIIGGLDIRSSTSSNAGIVINSNGIRGYKSNGQLGFEITNTGNVTFGGRLDSADGIFVGLVDGTLSQDTIDAIEINADQITANSITSNQIQAGSIDANSISVTSLSSISSNLGTITGGSISIDTDMYIGRTLWIGTTYNDSQLKSIRFGGGQGGSGISFSNDVLSISAVGGIRFEDDTTFYGNVDFSNANVTGI